ncbi:uncharacterized protein LOC107610438 [Arachis ipaensis]|uniref:uncharacterized protein LOC107610438 n=1 Tax=Arachis ipaensis TaxID=130454 RepID=UPI0007AF1281|nr:uncharacterized protein LOC107610438 [Arachis ipaensis]XP_025669738.1 uncharacterized protein LOC112769433 [Arachis hypogaea]
MDSQCKSDYSLFSFGDGLSTIVLLVYVDDIIIAGPDNDNIKRVEAKLKAVLKLKVLGDLKLFLGLELAKSSKGIFLSQRKYTLSLLEDTNFLGCKPASFPMDTNLMLRAVHQILRYLKSAPTQGILFSATNKFNLSVYADANWGSCLDTRRSTTGYCAFLSDSLVFWKSNKQAVVSRSSTEAEYRAIANASYEIV